MAKLGIWIASYWPRYIWVFDTYIYFAQISQYIFPFSCLPWMYGKINIVSRSGSWCRHEVLSATLSISGKWGATGKLLMSTAIQGKTTGTYYQAQENYWSNSWGGPVYQSIINTVAMLNYWIKLFFPDVLLPWVIQVPHKWRLANVSSKLTTWLLGEYWDPFYWDHQWDQWAPHWWMQLQHQQGIEWVSENPWLQCRLQVLHHQTEGWRTESPPSSIVSVWLMMNLAGKHLTRGVWCTAIEESLFISTSSLIWSIKTNMTLKGLITHTHYTQWQIYAQRQK